MSLILSYFCKNFTYVLIHIEEICQTIIWTTMKKLLLTICVILCACGIKADLIVDTKFEPDPNNKGKVRYKED